MALYDVSPLRASLLGDATTLGLLPPELLHIIRDISSPNLLNAISQAALIPQLTSRIYAHFEPAFADIAARWLLNTQKRVQDNSIIVAFARILPFCPHLSVFLDKCLVATTLDSGLGHPNAQVLRISTLTNLAAASESDLLRVLLALWRLLSVDASTYVQLAPGDLQQLFQHPTPAVRYLAIRIFCQVHAASDHKLESLLQQFIQDGDNLHADFDGAVIDFTFLTLFEHKRAKDAHGLLVKIRENRASFSTSEPLLQELSPLVVSWGSSVVPCPSGRPSSISSIIKTSATVRNLENLAQALRNQDPILLRGLPGSGKTSLIHEIARELGADSSLVSLHLNEQTDAKMLIGLYTTGSRPGSFEWRPGVLTTAVREGRWVLIEDLDRAPTEVMSTILPLIERRELLIPSRGETIKAPRSFRIFATVRAALGMHGQETVRSLLGERFWQTISLQPLPPAEVREILQSSFPSLHKLLPDVLSVFDSLTALSKGASGSAMRNAVARPISLRDVLKWCRRLEESIRLKANGTADGPMDDTVWNWMFLDAIDCFLGSVKEDSVRQSLGQKIGEALNISPETVNYSLTSYIPRLEDSENQLTAGRSTLSKLRRANRITKSKRPFATTTHAKRLLEQISTAVLGREPVLLVGETGIGKTTIVQQLADTLGHSLVAVNLSQQSEVGDLLGGFKPVNTRSIATPLQEEFEDLFSATGISAHRNEKYLDRIQTCLRKGKWRDVAKLWHQAPKMFEQIVQQLAEKERTNGQQAKANISSEEQPLKRRKTGPSRLQSLLELRPRWEASSRSLEQFDIQVSAGSGSLSFAFVEGKIIKAVRNGDWVLLDEINLASPDTLESIADLLYSGPNETPSILLSETGEIERIKAHPNFRIFGSMNPATDVGKRDLPIGLRSRFTELYVSSPDRDVKDLVTIIKSYLRGNSSAIDQVADRVAKLYLAIKQLAEDKALVDGANEVPHFSLRTLTRVLTYVNEVSPSYGLERAMFEGFCMGFCTLLSQKSENIIMPLILDHLFGKTLNRKQSLLSQPPKHPQDGREYVRFTNKDKDRQYWLLKGGETPQERLDYIRTAYVERNLLNLVRATSTRRFPILIQGPTSAGKTSMIEYLAHFSGNKFVRINNHEHTDLQEYLGTYVSGPDGKLKFQEGVLIQAMRQGHWIVLDELNLAPTDVLEALNRLLDDNRELLIPETQEVVRPHESFMLFATQNPPGLYGGRKVLSRAFRNRFLELHYDDIPESELGYILQKRCVNTSPSDCERIVTVYKELSRLRQSGRVFEQKNSFATLRDLFRWGLREAEDRQQIACNGFMLLAERVRDEEERLAVKEVIETVFKVKIDPDVLYHADSSPELRHFHKTQNSQDVIWTRAMRRLYVLLANALRNKEPVLLVGETGCGKTTVCQLLAEATQKELHIVNAHQNTETGDIIGSQRPIRNRGAILEALRGSLMEALTLLGLPSNRSVEQLLQVYHSLAGDNDNMIPEALRDRISRDEVRSKALFEWSDGSLVQAMKMGQYFLLDEISLADDSVLERLNSVLEPQRSLLLAEKGTDDPSVEARDGFQFFATMNPGGDFGKKELSPALRNRFTEIWVPSLSEDEDILTIVAAKLDSNVKPLAATMVAFASWFGKTFRSSSATPFSIREILVWVKFVNQCATRSASFAFVHGAATVFIDTLGANPSAMISLDPDTMREQRQKCLDKLNELLAGEIDANALYQTEPELRMEDGRLWAGEFGTARTASGDLDNTFEFEAPTTKMNAMRIVRALQMDKPILLEGNPGVGKTTLVSALARASGQPLTRINLSDQTDLMDLFGTDVPVEGAEAGNFTWRDAPFLQAMQKGQWVLLDEMNLASQSVLEGLNACLDHRGEVYISELDQVFKRHPDFKLFAAQNPHHQGGGRKGLPSSFVNRFIVVYADVFTETDQLCIAAKRAQGLSTETVRQIIKFVAALEREVVSRRTFGLQGSPWEFNLRDTLRWLELAGSEDGLMRGAQAQDFLDLVVRQRFRTQHDREQVLRLFQESFKKPHQDHSLYHALSSSFAQVGFGLLPRNPTSQPTRLPVQDMTMRLGEIESLLVCIHKDLPCILAGPSGSGKSTLLQHVAALVGKELVVFPLNADVDTMDLVGGFEQADPYRELHACLRDLQHALSAHLLEQLPQAAPDEILTLLGMLRNFETSTAALGRLAACIQSLAPKLSAESLVASILLKTHELLQQPLTLENPRFEWLDGIIVKAVQAGQWLVLDNANLCSASVLDRLNSLLERPNGSLIVNEHSGPDGEPRVITPHPDFRIFLTMDPKYGELSRAMRNRSVEIYVDMPGTQAPDYLHRITSVEAGMRRYHDAMKPTEDRISCLGLGNLSLQDASILDRFSNAVASQGLITGFTQTLFTNPLKALASYVHSQDSEYIRQAIFDRYSEVTSALTASAANGTAHAAHFQQLTRMQPLHPLQNFPMALARMDQEHGIPVWLDTCYEAYFELFNAHKQMEEQVSKANISKPSLMTRLQRSAVSHQVASVAGDSTVKVSASLLAMLRMIDDFLKATINDQGRVLGRRVAMRAILHYWWRTFYFVTDAAFEEVKFQAHLSQGTRLLENLHATSLEASTREIISRTAQRLDQDFVSGFKLTTGLSNDLLWRLLRPTPFSSEESLNQATALERLAGLFDKMRWRISSSIPDLGKIMVSLAEAYGILRANKTDASGLLKALTEEIQALEARAGDVDAHRPPIFTAEFEALRQLLLFHERSPRPTTSQETTSLLILADLPTVAQMRLRGSSGVASRLQMVDHMMCQDSVARPWSGTVSSSLLNKFDSISSVSMSSLWSLESEIPSMVRVLAKSSDAISQDAVDRLSQMLWDMMLEVVASHGPELWSQMTSLYSSLQQHIEPASVRVCAEGLEYQLPQMPPVSQATWPKHLSQIMSNHFCPAIIALAACQKGAPSREALAAVAWVQFSIGCIKLYTPDKVFDPYLKSQMEQEFHDTFREWLEQKISALRHFEYGFTGRRSNIRTELMEEEIEALGPGPTEKVASIYRPSSTQLNRIQKELFNAVLDVIVKNDISSTHYAILSSEVEKGTQQLQLIEDNVARLIWRLSSQLTAYQDLTAPLVNFLRCLQVGLSLTSVVVKMSSPSDEVSALLTSTPFLGASLEQVGQTTLPARSFDFLSVASLSASVDNDFLKSSAARNKIFECFHFFFDEWSKKLESDRRAEELNTSLYRFRGSLEDEEEADESEFQELFPDYTGEDDENVARHVNIKPVQHTTRDLALNLASFHKDIILSPVEPTEQIKAVCKSSGRRIAREAAGLMQSKPSMDEILLPAAMLVLVERRDAFDAIPQAGEYNFYTDSNLSEVRKLVSLVHDTQIKFRSLQRVDEIGHLQPLADVLLACDKVFEIGHSEPLARIIVAVEKLHEFVYEWQYRGFASKQYGAPLLYDRLTATIISWRKLELTTWSKLFDMEARKCKEDAASWWFIAYQAVIAGPLALLDSDSALAEHAAQLLHELATYLNGSILGQFSARLSLLRQLTAQLDLLVLEYPALTVIRNAIQHFISFYARYEPKAAEAIQKGRASLQKQMNDLLLLASWKDTNIVALRQSAQKSHQKLFKLVRKFRAVLGQSMGEVIAQGLPDEAGHANISIVASLTSANVEVDPAAAKTCQKLIPGWEGNAQLNRFFNVEKIVGIMTSASQLPDSSLQAADIVDTIVSDILSSISELKKETPAVLKDDNKDIVKHLKSRKTKLLNDTLKDIRQMGFARNLGETRLAAQKSMATIFSALGQLVDIQGVDAASSDYYFHKLIDLAPKSRMAAYEHHSDLSREVVQRCVGYLEGMLSVIIQQRGTLADATTNLKALQEATAAFKGVSSADEQHCVKIENQSTNHALALRWLIPVLKVALNLVQTHTAWAGADSKEVEAQLSQRIENLVSLQHQLDALPQLSPGFTTAAESAIKSKIQDEMQEFTEVLKDLCARRPDLGFVFRQVEKWTHISVPTLRHVDQDDGGIAPFMQDVLTISNKVLDGIQKFKKALADVPTSTENASWLVNYNACLSSAIKTIRMDIIARGLTGCIDKLRKLDLDDASVSHCASALLRLTLPIFQQYTAICSNGIAQLLALHCSTAKMGYHLSKSFTEIASQGFCSPQEKSDDKDGAEGKLESGTGLGEGEGAEDISKDIQPDEDLTDLAQEANKDQSGDVEDEKDAVDMGGEEMEGEMGSVAGEDDDEEGDKSGDEKDQENEMDEEVGDVDDLDPTAVDEKMWDGAGEDEAEKDQKGNKSAGEKKDDDQAAADQELQKQDQDDEQQLENKDDAGADEEVGPEQEDVLPQADDAERQDQNVQQEEAMALPEDMELDDADDGKSSDGEDNLDDLSDAEGEDRQDKDMAVSDGEMDDGPEDQRADHHGIEDDIVSEASERDADEKAEDSDSDNMDVDDAAGDGAEEEKPEEDKDTAPANLDDNHNVEPDVVADNDAQAGGGQDQDDSHDQDQNKSAEDNAKQEHGQLGENAPEDDGMAGTKGSASMRDDQAQDETEDQETTNAEEQPFKKLGDMLEKWYKNQRSIQAAEPDKQEQPQAQKDAEAEAVQKDFQHLENDHSAADAQALGTATKEEAKPLDDSMAIDNEVDATDDHVMPENEDMEQQQDNVDSMDIEEPDETKQPPPQSERDDGRSGVATKQGAYDGEDKSFSPESEEDLARADRLEDDSEDEGVEETSTQLSATHLIDADAEQRSFTTALEQWTGYQTKTHALSLSLASQLRLILTPSQSTKLSGAFRTGKRLNIKKIIPYIASSYKRDKIWMRRAVPTKRAYQILLAVDDSQSMMAIEGDTKPSSTPNTTDPTPSTSSGSLALESLVMVSRALAMLEAGQIGVLGFGADVFTAHDLSAPDPFGGSPTTGARALQRFTFAQDRTDVALLVRRTIDRFKAARAEATGSGAADLWQLALILSDGLTPSSSHEKIRRLLREASEERIMVVFIVMDDAAKKKGDSVLELRNVTFVKEGGEGASKVVVERYLDSFPFPYYLIVHHLAELPGALAGLLRTWFAEVNS